MPEPRRIAETAAILGAGAWGSALAVSLARGGAPVHLWGRDPARMEALRRTRRDERALPGVELPPHVQVASDLAAAVRDAGLVLVAVPSRAFRAVLEALAAVVPPAVPVAWATKGLEPDTGRLLHEVAVETLGPPGRPLGVVSGPTFAAEIAAGLPAAITVAATDPGVAARIAARVHYGPLRAYTATDVVGVELGGAVKNVLAIGAGIADGLGFGANTRTALITRGLAEMIRLGTALGGRRETFIGLAGLGDLVLTCTDDQSRNRRAGLALGRGTPLDAALRSIGQAVEGVPTAREVVRRARAAGIEMPITEQVYAVLYEGRAPRAAVQALLAREPRPEDG